MGGQAQDVLMYVPVIAAGLFVLRRLWTLARPERTDDEVAEKREAELYDAVLRRDVTSAAEALMNGASANHARVDRWNYGESSEPVLHLACKQHDLEMVELLISHGANPDAQYEKLASGYFEYEPCLHAAARGPVPDHDAGLGRVTPRHLEIMRILLENGADPNVPYRDRDDAYRELNLLGSVQDSPELVALLLKHGART
jgi:hypothetical protein